MKYFISFCFAWLFACSAFSQSSFLLREGVDSVGFTLGVQSGKLAITAPSQGSRTLRYLDLSDLKLSDADLVLEFQPRSIPKGLDLELRLELRDAQGKLIRPGPFAVSRSAPSGASKGMHQISWLDATENVLELGSYTLYIRQELRGTINCSGKRPEFSIKQQLPYYGVAGAGLMMSGLGLVSNARKKDAYQRYQEVWANEGQKSEAAVHLEAAQTQEKRAKILLYGGLAVLGVNAGLYTWRWIRVRHRQQQYDTYCAPENESGIRLEPVLDWSGNGMAVGARIGLGRK